MAQRYTLPSGTPDKQSLNAQREQDLVSGPSPKRLDSTIADTASGMESTRRLAPL